MLGYDAARWHAVLNDLPAALLSVAVLFDLAAAVTKRGGEIVKDGVPTGGVVTEHHSPRLLTMGGLAE